MGFRVRADQVFSWTGVIAKWNADDSGTVSTTTTIRIHHLNGDSTQRYAKVVTNGVTKVVAFLPTADGDPGTSILTVPLNAGTGNTIVFESYDASWAPDIDRLMVPVS